MEGALLEPHQHRANVVHGTLIESQLGEVARGCGQVTVVLGKAQAHEVYSLLQSKAYERPARVFPKGQQHQSSDEDIATT